MAKIAFNLLTKGHDGRVRTYNRVPQAVVDLDGLVVDLELTLLDDDNFPDRKEYTVLRHVQRQLNRQDAGRGMQTGYGPISVNEISKASGIEPRTVIGRLRRLQERRVIDLDESPMPPKMGRGTLYMVGIHLPVTDWQIAKVHVA